MPEKSITIDQLYMLTKIAETGSILAAAEALYRTQPTVSIAIKKLEKELGVLLLSRDSYRAQLTTEGRQLCKKAYRILEEVEDFARLADHLALGNEPQVNIAVEVSCSLTAISQVMKRCEQQFPRTQFNLSVENIYGAQDKLLRGECDIAICPMFQEISQVESVLYTNTTLIPVASQLLDLTKSDEVITRKSLQDYVQIIVRDSSANPRDESYGVISDVRHWYVNDHFSKKQLIVAGMGWGRLHQHYIEQELETGSLKRLNIEKYPNSHNIDVFAMRRLGETVGPVAEMVWQEFTQKSSE